MNIIIGFKRLSNFQEATFVSISYCNTGIVLYHLHKLRALKYIGLQKQIAKHAVYSCIHFLSRREQLIPYKYIMFLKSTYSILLP